MAGVLYSARMRAKKRNGMHDSIPNAQVRGSARGLYLRYHRAISVPKATPMIPARTVMPPNMSATLKKIRTCERLKRIIFL